MAMSRNYWRQRISIGVCFLFAAFSAFAAGDGADPAIATKRARQAFRMGAWSLGYELSADADQTDDEIQFFLGHCLENGLGGAVCDEARARTWYEKSAAQGNEKAKAALARLDGRSRERQAQAEAERKRREAEKAAADALRKRITAEQERIAAEREKAENPGYGFDETLGKAIWIPGLRHPSVPHIKAAEKEGSWAADPGYRWKKKGEAFAGVVWSPGMGHPDYPHVVASDEEGKWVPESGWEWVNKDESWEVRKKQAKTISFEGMGENARIQHAFAIMNAAINDISNTADESVSAMKSMMQLISAIGGTEMGLQMFKAAWLQSAPDIAAIPSLSEVNGQDEERLSIVFDMGQCVVNDGRDLEHRLNRIESVLRLKGSNILKTGNLGRTWVALPRK